MVVMAKAAVVLHIIHQCFLVCVLRVQQCIWLNWLIDLLYQVVVINTLQKSLVLLIPCYIGLPENIKVIFKSPMISRPCNCFLQLCKEGTTFTFLVCIHPSLFSICMSYPVMSLLYE